MKSLGLQLLSKTVFCKTQTSHKSSGKNDLKNFALTGVECFTYYVSIFSLTKSSDENSIRGAIHVSEGDSFVLEAPVQHGAELLLVLGGELEDGDLLAAVLLDVLQPHQGLELGDGPRGVQVSLGEEEQHRGGLQARLVQELCDGKKD